MKRRRSKTGVRNLPDGFHAAILLIIGMLAFGNAYSAPAGQLRLQRVLQPHLRRHEPLLSGHEDQRRRNH